MNYRHAYHAGNFADVVKHLILALVIDYMKRKEAAFRVIDTHAGSGRYALDSAQAAKTGEWRGGIGRVLGTHAKPLPAAVAQVMAPYLDAVRAENSGPQLEIYPGSPLIARRLLRAQDVLAANELHPEDGAALKAALGRDRRIRLLALDGWVALRSLLPPKERRAVVLIDPPFEEEGDLLRLNEGLADALRRFESGTYLGWYPIKDVGAVAAFHKALASRPGPELLRVELMIRGGQTRDRLNGCGVIVANPPYTLRDQLAVVLPELTHRMGDGAGARHRLDRLDQAVHTSPVQPAGSRRRKVPKAAQMKR